MWGVTNTELGGSSGTKQEKKETKAVTAKRVEKGQLFFRSSDYFSSLLKESFIPAAAWWVPKAAQWRWMSEPREKKGIPLISLALPVALAAWAGVRKAEGVKLEEAAAASCSQTIWKELKPAVCGFPRVRKRLPDFSGDFCVTAGAS